MRKLGSLFVFHGWEVKREKEAIKKGGKKGRERFFFSSLVAESSGDTKGCFSCLIFKGEQQRGGLGVL